MKKRIVSLLLCLALFLSLVPTVALAEKAEDISRYISEYGSVTLTDNDGDGFYEIDSAAKLYAFSSVVNYTDGKQNINGKLTANIVVNEGKFDANGNYTENGETKTPKEWKPIGYISSGKSYGGTFDGQGYTISGLYYNDNAGSYNNGGLFGCLNGATVQNVTVKDSYFRTTRDSASIGAIAGSGDGSARIENCHNVNSYVSATYAGGIVGSNSGTIERGSNSGAVTGCLLSNQSGYYTKAYAGGIVGYNSGNIKDCYNIGKLTATVDNSVNNGKAYAGGITGYNRSGTISNCYNTGAAEATAKSAYYTGSVVGYNSDGSVSGYYLAASETDSLDGTTFKTAAQFASGEVCYLLNGSTSEGTLTWYQTLGTDKTPVLDSTHGKVDRASSNNHFNNTKYYGDPYHIYDETTHKCKITGCSAMDPANCAARVTHTENGTTTTTYYASFNEAYDAATTGDTITLLADANVGLTRLTKDITLDLNGHKFGDNTRRYITNGSDGTMTIIGPGTILRLGVGYVNGADTVGGNMTLKGNVEYSEVPVQRGSLTVESGTVTLLQLYTDLNLAPVKLYGGTFGRIRRTPGGSAPGYGALLADGYGYMQTDNESGATTWYDKDSTYPDSVELTNVTVAKLPIQSVTITPDKTSYTYGEDITLTANTVDSATYQWYTVNGTTETAIDGAASATYSPENLSLGTYTFRVKVTKDGYTRSADVTVTVNTVDITDAVITLGPSLTYNGQLQTQTVSSVTVGGKTLGTDDYTISGNTGTNATGYTLTITGTGSYTGTATKDWSIETAEAPELTAATTEIIYTLTPYTVDLSKAISGIPTDAGTVSYAFKVPGDPTRSISGNTLTINKNGSVDETINVMLVVSFDNYNDARVTVSIKLVDKTTKPLTVGMAGWTYGDTANEPTYTKPDGATNLSVQYKAKGAADDTYSATVPTDAGDYTVRVSYETTTEIWSGTADFAIGKAPLTVTAKPHTITYGEAPANNGVEYSAFVGSETASVLGGTLSYDYSYTQYGDVGSEYTITPKGLTADNYNITFVPGTLTVNQKEVGLKWSNTSLTYDGSAQAPTATAIDLVGSDSCTVTVSGAQTNAGENYTATAASLSNSNYKLPADNTKSFSIAPASLTGVSAEQTGTLTYNGEPQAATVTTAATAVGGQTVSFTYSDAQSGVYSASVPSFTTAGDHTVYYKASAANHETATGSFKVTIGRKPIAIPAADTTVFTYNGQPQTYTIAESTDYTVSGNVQTNANERGYTVTVALTDKANTMWADQTDADRDDYTFVIGKASVTVTAVDKSAYVGAAAPDLSSPVIDKDYTITGLFGDDTLEGVTVTLSCDADMNKLDSYDIVVTVSGENENYTVTTENGALTVSARPVDPAASGYVPNIPESEGGSVSVSPSRPAAGDSVTITPKPDAGYEVGKVTVTDKNGDRVPVRENKDGSFSFIQPEGSVTIRVTFQKTDGENQFEDVPSGSYFEEAVNWAVSQGITTGLSAKRFGPNESCTRAQAVTFLWRAAGCPEPETKVMPFSDVSKDSYYYKAVLWALENGITNGTTATTFSPDDTCTRAQIVTFLWRALGEPESGSENPFLDVHESAYYTKAVLWALKEEVTTGTSANAFGSDADCTRAQIVTFLYRAMKEK